MRAVHGNADAAAHDDAVDQRHVRLAILFDLRVERVLLAKKVERLLVAAGAPEIVERAQIAAGGERAAAARAEDHARDRGIGLPLRELLRERAHHGAGHRVERLRPIERDQPGGAAPLEQDVGLGAVAHAVAHR